MARGLAVVSGSTVIHKLLTNGHVSFSGSVALSGNMVPDQHDTRSLGSDAKRWKEVFTSETTVGAIFEYGLETIGIGELETGTVVSWHNGKLEPCSIRGDVLVMGVTKKGKDQPIILGAESILVTGYVEEGDFLIASSKIGHAESISKNSNYASKSEYIGKIIGQALENNYSESNLIKCMISKR